MTEPHVSATIQLGTVGIAHADIWRPRASPPTGAGGTPTRTTTRPSMATSSATSGFVWCPEGLDEADVRLLGPVAGAGSLEVGCGAAALRALAPAQGADAVGTDLSAGMLRHARAGRRHRRTAAAGAGHRDRAPVRRRRFDLACSAFGAVPFVTDSDRLMAEVFRVLKPGGRWVFSVTHPMRWVFPDDPGEAGLVAQTSYFDRTPYVEIDDKGAATYAEHHRTLGDRIREIVGAGFALTDLIEPEWPQGHARLWGQWSPLRGRIFPGTAIFVCDRP